MIPFTRLPSACLILLACLVTAATVPSSGCKSYPDLPLPPGSPAQQFTFHSSAGGGARSYLLRLPSGYDGNHPTSLILNFHGKAQTASTFANGINYPYFNTQSVTVFPQGLQEQWTGDPEAPLTSIINDIPMVGNLLSHLSSTLCIDLTRLYAFGFSNGGGLVDLLACDPAVSRRIAAFAATSAAVYRDEALKEPLWRHCPSRSAPVPFLEFHGTKDPVVDYDGERTPDGPSWSVADRMQHWARVNGCAEGAGNETVMLYEGHVWRYAFSCGENEDGGNEDVVQQYRIEGFGHGVPTTTPLDNDGQRYGPTWFNATPVVLEFFGRWRLPDELLMEDYRDEL